MCFHIFRDHSFTALLHFLWLAKAEAAPFGANNVG